MLSNPAPSRPDWQYVSSYSLPVQLREGVQRVIQAVYEQKRRTMPQHLNADISYNANRPGAVYILVKEGLYDWAGGFVDFDSRVVG